MPQTYDVVIIGAGSAGAGVARDAAMRGLKTCLVERNDIASGAIATCAGMISTGLKYLDEPEMVEMCRMEVPILRRIAPHLVFRIPIITAILDMEDLSRGGSFAQEYTKWAEKLKDTPALLLPGTEARALEPRLNPDTLGAVFVAEWFADPFRFTLLNVLDAARHGATIRTYTQVTDILIRNGQVAGVRVLDKRKGREEVIWSRVIVNAAGPWAMKVAELAGIHYELRLNKGSTIIFDRRITNTGVTCRALDGRLCYLFPHENTSILGVTAIDIFCDPDEATATPDEIEYLIRSMEFDIRSARILRIMTGVRPLLAQWKRPEGEVTRSYEVVDHGERDGVENFITLAGGKFVIYRRMAEDTTNLICKKLGVQASCRTHLEPLPGGEQPVDVEEISREFGVSLHVARRLAARHGALTPKVLEPTRRRPELKTQICTCDPITAAEAIYSLDQEMVSTLTDLRRRIWLGCGPCQGTFCSFRILPLLADRLRLPPEEAFTALLDFLQERWKGMKPVLRGAQLSQAELAQAIYAGVFNLTSPPPPDNTIN